VQQQIRKKGQISTAFSKSVFRQQIGSVPRLSLPALQIHHPEVRKSTTQRSGGDGWFGAVGASYNWQFNQTWVDGIFADGTYRSLKGTLSDAFTSSVAPRSLRDTYMPACALCRDLDGQWYCSLSSSGSPRKQGG
jgi:hypothetical protein